MFRRTATIALGLCLVAAGCGDHPKKRSAAGSVPTTVESSPSSSVPPSTAPASSQPQLQPKVTMAWAPCGEGFECATIPPPLDYDHPENGRTADLAVARLKASGTPNE